MNMLKVAISAACLVGLAGAVCPVSAEGVKMYNAPPSVEELKGVLGGGAPQKKVKFRKLEFGDETSSKAPVHEQPTTASSGGDASGKAVGFPINFAYNSAEIDPKSRPFLDTIGQLLAQQKDMRLIIEGHTDASGSPSYNMSLSKRRAASVKNYLSGQFGVDTSRLISVGKGQSEPLAPEDPNGAQNRRVQFRPAG